MKGLKTYFTYLQRNKLFYAGQRGGTGHLSDVCAAYCQYGGAAAHCGQRYKGHRAYLCVVERGI